MKLWVGAFCRAVVRWLRAFFSWCLGGADFFFFFNFRKGPDEFWTGNPYSRRFYSRFFCLSVSTIMLTDKLCSYNSKFKYFVRIVFTSHKLKLGLMFPQDCPFFPSQVKAFSPAMVTLVPGIPELLWTSPAGQTKLIYHT